MNNFDNYTDSDLLNIFVENDAVVFREIYKRYWYKLFVFVNKRLRNKESSEEIIQNFFTRFWLNRSEIKVKGSLEAYMFTAVRYATIDYLEKEATRNNYYQLAYFNNKDFDNSTEEQVLLHDLETNVEYELVKLPVKCRSVFVLSRYEHKSNKEIAMQLGISEKTVENHITNAIRQLRLSLKGVACAILVYLFFYL